MEKAVHDFRDDNEAGQKKIISQVQTVGLHTTHSLTNVLDVKLPAIEQSLTSSITEQLDNSTSSVERRVVQSSADIMMKLQTTSAETILLHRDQQKRVEDLASNQAQVLSIMHRLAQNVLGDPENGLTSEMSESLSREKSRRSRKYRQVDSSQCTCNVKVHGTVGDRRSVGLRLGNLASAFYKERETSTIHDRRCPLWYTSRRSGVYWGHLRVWNQHISGSLELKRSLYGLFSGLEILPHIRLRPIVPWDSPSFRVIRRYMYHDAGADVGADAALSCLNDLRLVFQSGLGSPLDVQANGDNLLHVSCPVLLARPACCFFGECKFEGVRKVQKSRVIWSKEC